MRIIETTEQVPMKYTKSTSEEVHFRSARVHNPGQGRHTVRAYYEAADPIEQRIVTEERILEPSQNIQFAPRTYTVENGQAHYGLNRLELLNTESNVQPTADQLQPVILETRHHAKHNKNHGQHEIEVEIIQDTDTGFLKLSPTHSGTIYRE